MKGDGTAWGYNFGILLKPTANLQVGLAYRSPFTLKIKDGDVDISNISGDPIASSPIRDPFPARLPAS